MANDNKDRFGEKMHDVEAAREDQWARQHDAQLIEKLRERLSAMVCPHCKKPLVAKSHGNLQMLACPTGEGAWFEEKALKAVLKDQK
jgi:uncharacterized protein YbaR (Trm112 family)